MRGMMRLALLGVPGTQGGEAPITWLLKASFEGPDLAAGEVPAELGMPYVEVGGPLMIVQSGSGKFAVSDNALLFPSGGNSWNAATVRGDAIGRANGVAVLFGVLVDVASAHARIGLSNNASIGETSWSSGLYIHNSGQLKTVLSSFADLLPYSATTDYTMAFVMFDSCTLVLVKIGVISNWILIHVDLTTDAIVYPALASHSQTGVFNLWRARQLPAPFDVDYGPTTIHEATPVSGTSYTATANAIHDLTITAPNPLAGECALEYRVADDNNKWRSYFNSSGAYRLDSVASGAATNRINVASAITAGATRTLRTRSIGTRHNAYTLSGTNWTKRGGEINHSHQDTATTIKPVAGAGWTLGALRSWPTTSPAYAELDRT